MKFAFKLFALLVSSFLLTQVIPSPLSSTLASAAYDIIVDPTGSGGAVKTVQDAIKAIPSNSSKRTTVFIKNGIYKEKVTLNSDKTNVTFIGESLSGTKITYDDYNGRVVNGTTLGTGTSATVTINASGFEAANITFENSYGIGKQAVAVLIQANRIVFSNCRFTGHQDTLYVKGVQQYFKNCIISGETDFIFGPATTLFDQCEIDVGWKGSSGCVTAPSTTSDLEYGLVFMDCKFMNNGIPSGKTTLLARAWWSGPNLAPKQAIIRSYIDSIFPSATSDAYSETGTEYSNPSAIMFSEYKNTGPGVSLQRKQLTDSQASNYTMANILSGWTPDIPGSPQNITLKAGDANSDGKINSTDLSLIKRHILSINLLAGDALKASDVNGDQKVNSLDASYIKRYILGTIYKFPIEQ